MFEVVSYYELNPVEVAQVDYSKQYKYSWSLTNPYDQSHSSKAFLKAAQWQNVVLGMHESHLMNDGWDYVPLH